MKKQILLLTAASAFAYITLSSNLGGAADPSSGTGGNRTGAKASSTTCGGSGCHGTGTSTTASISVKSGSTTVTQYVPGNTYTVTISGSNTSSLPKFGFQFAAVSGSGSTQVQAGTFSGLPTNVASHTFTSLSIIEQTSQLSGSSGTYTTSFNWTAPTTAVGTITMYCTLNAVDGNGSENSADISGNTSTTLTPSTTAVGEVSAEATVKAYPNPTVNSLNVTLDNAQTGSYTVQAFDMNGKIVTKQIVNVNGGSNTTTLNTSNWARGNYHIAIEKEGFRKVIPVVKQ